MDSQRSSGRGPLGVCLPRTASARWRRRVIWMGWGFPPRPAALIPHLTASMGSGTMQLQATARPAAPVSAIARVARPFAPHTAPKQSHPRNQGSRRALTPRSTGQERLLVAALSGMAAANGGTAASSNRLLIVGPGVLGSYLGKLWIDDHGADTAVGQTNTTTNHAKWVLLPV